MDLSSSKNKKIGKDTVYAIIDGEPVILPSSAKFICQDKRGCWFYCTRRPRIKNDDWTPNKSPVQLINGMGKIVPRVIITASSPDWKKTLQRTINQALLPELYSTN